MRLCQGIPMLLLCCCAPDGGALDVQGATPRLDAAAWQRTATDLPGVAWSSREVPGVEVVVVHDDSGVWTRGLYVLQDGEPLATWSPRTWLGEPGWIPLVIATERDASILVAEDTRGGLELGLAGSTEHGCPSDDLWVTVRVAPGTVRFDIQGIPYLVLPGTEPAWIANTEGLTEVAAGETEEFTHVSGLFSRFDEGHVSLNASSPLAWLQVQGHPANDIVEIDLDHGCDAEPRPSWSVTYER